MSLLKQIDPETGRLTEPAATTSDPRASFDAAREDAAKALARMEDALAVAVRAAEERAAAAEKRAGELQAVLHELRTKLDGL